MRFVVACDVPCAWLSSLLPHATISGPFESGALPLSSSIEMGKLPANLTICTHAHTRAILHNVQKAHYITLYVFICFIMDALIKYVQIHRVQTEKRKDLGNDFYFRYLSFQLIVIQLPIFARC